MSIELKWKPTFWTVSKCKAATNSSTLTDCPVHLNLSCSFSLKLNKSLLFTQSHCSPTLHCLHATGWWKFRRLYKLAECSTNFILNYRSPSSVLRLHSLFFCIHLSPSFLLPPLKWMADKSIAIMLPVLSFLSRASSAFIFILQRLLRDLSFFLFLSCLELLL